jgi:hypothetical protein
MPQPKHYFASSRVLVGHRLRQADRTRSWNAGGAIHRVDFRHRVLVSAMYLWRFEPRSGCRDESAVSRRGINRERAEAAFPAAASAVADQHT